tara:strand:- start:10992 stop:11471 length:480 start_codon:yes stop_codon:yes gene_type:complete
MMNSVVNESAFYMWRTLISVAHADNIVTDEEIEFIAQMMENIDFSDEQTAILKDDILNAKDVSEMFTGVTSQKDRIQFFEFARDLVWVDGDFASEEQSVMIQLYQQHMQETDVDELIGHISLELEEDSVPTNLNRRPDKKTGFRKFLSSFRGSFSNRDE